MKTLKNAVNIMEDFLPASGRMFLGTNNAA